MKSAAAVLAVGHATQERPRLSPKIYLLLLTCVAALGGLLFGYDTAVISGAIGLLESHFGLSAAATGWAASCALAGCVFGATAAGLGCDRFGRRRALVFAGICFLVSAVGTALAVSFTTFVVYRIVGGLGIGAASVASPLYIGESAPARHRGALVAINQLAVVLGMLLIYLVNYQIRLSGTPAWNNAVGWRWMFASGTLPSSLLLGLLLFVPETARFLAMRGRYVEAERVASRTGATTLEEIMAAEAHPVNPDTFRRRALFIGVSLAILQQVTGINVFLYYAPSIFGLVNHSRNAALWETVIVGAVNVVFTCVAMGFVDRVGRKPLLLSGCSGMMICLFSMGWALMHGATSAWLLPCVIGYIACFAFSIGPVTWIVLAEIFPSGFRAKALSISTAALWMANFVVSQTFPMINENRRLVSHFGQGSPFFLYGASCLVEIVFVSLAVPETKNQTLEQISAGWSRIHRSVDSPS